MGVSYNWMDAFGNGVINSIDGEKVLHEDKEYKRHSLVRGNNSL